MDEIAGDQIITTADIDVMEAKILPELHNEPLDHIPPTDDDVVMTPEEGMINDRSDGDMQIPDLEDQGAYDSDSEADDEDELLENEDHDPLEPFLQDDSGSEELIKELEEAVQQATIQRSQRNTKGVRCYDEAFDWNLMNLSVNTAFQGFGAVAEDACKNELVQLFKEKSVLIPVKREDLSQDQLKKVVRSHMFLKEKFEDGTFVKLKACLVVDG
jgi:hypothetical protein